ncbi:MAG: HYR domain-containing protein [Saprospiraceae bacterium]|nr:HYR domain-containing protein [Saprospiraceae bacterium]MBK7797030.1 HYR domain-containing protein [Saprospiraceae bacterium]MBL0259577.1 HYR domain-containing protein [Saprospiraceae bacterium]
MNPLTVLGNGVRKLCPSGLFRLTFALVLLWTGSAVNNLAHAQCSMACRGKVNVSVGVDCAVELTPSMFLTKGVDCPSARYRVDLLDYNMKLIPGSPFVGSGHIKKNLIAMVYDSTSKNSCWSYLLIEDKGGPIIECKNDTTYCNDTAVYNPPVFYDWCDPHPTIELVDRNPILLDCDTVFVKMIVRSWQAKDAWGNLSKICVDTIWLKKIPLDSVHYPKDYVHADECHLECNGIWPKDDKGHPHPDATGVPTVHGLPLWPEYNAFCNTGASYEDIVLVQNECKTKILRVWRVVEWWCGQAKVHNHPQTIEIIDSKPPYIHCPYNLTVNTSSGYTDCRAIFNLPPAFVFDSCQDSIRVDVYYENGILLNSNGGLVTLTEGEHTVTYRAYDRCGNLDTCQVHVSVLDRTPPVAVCQRQTVITMSRDDEVHLYGTALDDGSHDECHLDSFLVRRMDLGFGCGFNDKIFRPYVRFCCMDVGKIIPVALRVVDKAGNYNECMVLVEVQDKTPPVIYCPHDVTIACSNHIDTADFKNHFGTASYYDNCVVTMHEYIEPHLNQCNLGYYDRNFVVRDNMGRYDTCTQKIFVRDTDLFDERYIIWPHDTTITSCGANTDPAHFRDTFGYPIILDRTCALIGISFEDHVFNFIQDTNLCFKVLRKWKIIDWCQLTYDQDNNPIIPTWTHEQVIKVHNKLPPKMLDDCEPLTICVSDDNCLKGLARLRHIAEDDCTPDSLLRSGFKLDLYNNGLFDSTYFQLGNRISVDIELPLGEHEFFWFFEDQCGNQTVCAQIVRILNCKGPTAYCLTGVAVNLMGVDTDKNGTIDDGLATVWASDLDKGSYQICGNPVTLSFSRDTNDKYRNYDCDSLGLRRVTIWVTDQLTGLQDYCVTNVVVQDNNKVCSGSSTFANIAGAILTPYDEPIKGVEIQVNGRSNPMAGSFSGQFAFSGLLRGENYTISASREINYLEGISTLDIVKIQKHILGKETFSEPWQYLAADVTNDHRVTASDISALRKLILGVDSKYLNNLSWKFIEGNYVFPVKDDPWAESFNEKYQIQSLPGDMMYLDFRGIKVGDVSKDMWDLLSSGQARSAQDAVLRAEVAADGSRIAFRATETFEMEGFQCWLEFNHDQMHAVGVQPGAISLQENQINWMFADNGLLPISWNSEQKKHVEAGEVLFYLLTDREVNQEIVAKMAFNVGRIRPELYLASGETKNLVLESRESDIAKQVVFKQLLPNPFTDQATVEIDSPLDAEMQIEIISLEGKILTTKMSSMQKGHNLLRITKEMVGQPGVYNLRLTLGSASRMYKLILLNN